MVSRTLGSVENPGCAQGWSTSRKPLVDAAAQGVDPNCAGQFDFDAISVIQDDDRADPSHAMRSATTLRTFKAHRSTPRDDERQAMFLLPIQFSKLRLRQFFLELHHVARHDRPLLKTLTVFADSCGEKVTEDST